MPAFTRRQYSGAAVATTITAGINTTDTTCSLAATTGWPSSAGVSFYVVINPGTSAEEKCSATISGSTLTLVRAQDDTSASSHPTGSTIYPVFTANDADEANEIVSKLTTKGDLLVTTGSILNRLSVGTNDYSLLADSAATNGVAWKQVPTAGIADGAITTAKIAAGAVEEVDIASDAVTTVKILNANVTTAKLADKSVTSAKLGALTTAGQAGAYTFVLGDAETLVKMTGGSPVNFTIPLNSSVAFPLGTQLNVLQEGAGQVTIVGTGGVTVVSEGSKFKTKAQWAIATAIKLDTNTWVVVGNLAA